MASFKKLIKRTLEATLAVRVYSTRPHGRDDCHDLQSSGVAIETILDVGANDGGSALKFHEAFPRAVIHSFEPVSSTFEALCETVAGIPQVRCHRLALGRAAGTASIFLTGRSTTNSLVPPEDPKGEEEVEVTSVEKFASDHDIAVIDLLKIDTEGYDLEVIRGAVELLDRAAIRFILAEVGFHPGDGRHVLFDDIRDYLAQRDYRVYGFYDQQLEWSGENRLQYANVCFCHGSVSTARLGLSR